MTTLYYIKWEKIKQFPLKSDTSVIPLSTFTQRSARRLSYDSETKKQRNGIQIMKAEVTAPLFAGNMILYI